MKKIILLLSAIVMLTGCASIEKRIADTTEAICNMSPAEQVALAERADKITKPNKIRVECN